MGGFNFNAALANGGVDPTQQLNQPPNTTQQLEQQGDQSQARLAQALQQRQPAQPQQQPGSQPGGGDPVAAAESYWTQQLNDAQAQQQKQAGSIKSLLGNWFGAMMGQTPPAIKAQIATNKINALETNKAMIGLHQAQMAPYQMVPMLGGDGKPISDNDGNPVHVPAIYAQQMQMQLLKNLGTATVAQTNVGGRIGAAEINQGMLIPVTEEMRQTLNLPPGTTQIPLKQLREATGVATAPLSITQGAQGPAVVNRLNPGQATQLPIGNPRAIFAPQNRYGEFVDPNNPDVVRPMTFGQAAATGATSPQSVGYKANLAVTRSATSGPIANQLTAFNTALQHAALLKQAATALQNGDVRTLNSISNRAMSEFGDPNLTNYQAIAGAYSREITKMLSGGHMTDAEIASSGGTLPSNANLATISKVLDSYKSLAQSKINVLKNQVQQGKTGQPAFEQPNGIGNTGVQSFRDWKNRNP